MTNEQESTAQKRVLEFLENEIQGFVVGDLTRLGSLSPDGTEPFTCQCTVPESLAVFSVLELMGFLMRDDFNEEQGLDMPKLLADQSVCGVAQGTDKATMETLEKHSDDTWKNIKYMMEKWLQYDTATIHMLISLFRHGGAHRFFPKAAGIGRNGLGSPVLVIHIHNKFPYPILNEDRLREDYLATNKTITKIIKNNDDVELHRITGDQVCSLVVRMDRRLSVLNYIDRKKLKNILRNNPHASFPAIPTTTTSANTISTTAQLTTTTGIDYLRYLRQLGGQSD